jgi:hypothetical protein
VVVSWCKFGVNLARIWYEFTQILMCVNDIMGVTTYSCSDCGDDSIHESYVRHCQGCRAVICNRCYRSIDDKYYDDENNFYTDGNLCSDETNIPRAIEAIDKIIREVPQYTENLSSLREILANLG